MTSAPLDRGILFTDQYQLTMAQLYFRQGLHEREAEFDYFYRSNPNYGSHQAGFCVTAGLEEFVAWMHEVRFGEAEIEHLRGHTGVTGRRLFDDDFLAWLLAAGDYSAVSIEAIPEGRVVHPHLPVIVVTGPLAMCQLLETSLLNQMNYPTLIATKAARLAHSARGGRLLEFGMRRGPGWAVNEATRASLIGGCDASSNAGVSHTLGVMPAGTHAHSMVQAFLAVGDGELAAFSAYANQFPDDCLLLVDTIDTLESGVPNAITVFQELRNNGHEPVGIRLDSGDLAHLAIQSAALLNQAGFPDAAIVLSAGLDELAIWQILTQIDEEAAHYGVEPAELRARLVYGVGTSLVTSMGSPALDGVYKLVALRDQSGTWKPTIKVSESAAKIPIPGRKSVWRAYDHRGRAIADVVAAEHEDLSSGGDLELHHPYEFGVSRVLARSEIAQVELLLAATGSDQPIPVEQLRARCQADIANLDPGVRRLVNPHRYHVSLTAQVKQLQLDLLKNL